MLFRSYLFLTSVIQGCYRKKKERGLSVSDRIDKVVTNRFLALPIFAFVMFLVYYVSVTTVGGMATDWANDGVFGDGWYLFGMGRGDYEAAAEEYEIPEAIQEAFLTAAKEAGAIEEVRATDG